MPRSLRTLKKKVRETEHRLVYDSDFVKEKSKNLGVFALKESK